MKRSNSRLRSAHVHVGGCGRIGSAVVLALHAAGVGKISCNDPQMLEEEQLGPFVFSRRSDLGQPKVHVLERFLNGRPNLEFVPIVARNQATIVKPYIEQTSILVSCANRMDARVYLEGEAVRLRKPIIQASVQDARISLGGTITLWHPHSSCSCFGCFGTEPGSESRNELLLPSVTSAIGTLAAHLAVLILGPNTVGCVTRHNVYTLDFENLLVEPISVQVREQCIVCAGAQR